MKKVLWLIVCLMTMVMFASCSKDEHINEIGDNTSIVGMWETTYAEGYYSFTKGGSPSNFNKTLTNDDEELFMRFEFLPNNTAKEYLYHNNQWEYFSDDNLLYVINDNKLRVYEDVTPWKEYYNGEWDGNIDNTYTILHLSDKKLVLRLDSKDASIAKLNNILDQYVIVTFKRIY